MWKDLRFEKIQDRGSSKIECKIIAVLRFRRSESPFVFSRDSFRRRVCHSWFISLYFLTFCGRLLIERERDSDFAASPLNCIIGILWQRTIKFFSASLNAFQNQFFFVILLFLLPKKSNKVKERCWRRPLAVLNF